MSGGRLFPWILILCCILVCGCMVPFPDIRPGTDPEGSSYGTEPVGSVVPEHSTAPENTTAPAEPGTGVPSETEGTQPAPTEPPVTEPPVTEPPATEPPATEPPATEPPATEPPATEPPATEPPATEPPATEPAPTEPAPPDEPAFSRFLGRLMPEDIAEVNARTLANPSSMLYDVLGGCTYAYEDVLFMLNSYGMPNTPYLGYGPFTDDRKADLVRNTNRDFLLKKMQEEPGGRVPVRYAILLKNADVRAFPTVERATAAMLDRDHDRMQETKLPYASGVLILHESLDGQWYFVQGEYYYGWILKSDATEADRASFRSYLTADRIAVSLTPSGPEPWQRLGVILPIEDRTADTLTVRVPARNEYGNFCTETRVIPAAGFSEGFLPWDPEDCAARMRALSGLPYGWGDTGNGYDCSSTSGGIYRLYGLYTPRNTSIMTCFGGTVTDVTAYTAEEKAALIRSHPGALLLCPGHVMVSLGTSEPGMYVPAAHNVVGFNLKPDGTERQDVYRVAVTDLASIYNGSGAQFLSLVTAVIYYEP